MITKTLFFFFWIPICLLGEEPSTGLRSPAISGSSLQSEKNVMSIDPKNRSRDWHQAFEYLKKDKPSMKLFIKTGSTVLSNVTDIVISEAGTLLFVKIPYNQGSKFVILPVEEVQEIGYLF